MKIIDCDIKTFKKDCSILASRIKNVGYRAIYGVPRGGIYVAMELSNLTDIPIIDTLPLIPDISILVVDDLIDSGTTRAKYSEYNFACLHVKPKSNVQGMVYRVDVLDGWITYWWEKNDNNSTIEDNIIRIIELIGEDPQRPGLVDTPARVAKMYKEFFVGYNPLLMPKITIFKNGEDGLFYNEMLIDQGYFFSFCEHHILPFFGSYSYAYIPGDIILGASKISRVIDYYSGRLQIAERLVNQVINCFDDACHPLGQVLIMNARHLCKEMRGVKKWNSPFEAIAVRGYFAENRNGCKDEFMARVSSKK